MSKVSIIIPVYNVEQYLKQCLTSVVNQTLQDIEIIIINNGASINEQTIINNYAKNDKRIKIINFDENQGYAKALNTGIKQAVGDYIGIVESDDYIELNMYEKLYNQIKEYDADIIKSAYIAFNEKKERTEFNNIDIPLDKTFTLPDAPVLISSHPSIWSCLYKKQFLIDNNIFFTENKKYAGWVDNAFQLETLYRAKKIIYTKEAFYHYRDCRPQSSSCLNKKLKVPYMAVKEMYNVINKYNIENEEILYNLSLRIMSYIKITIDRAEYSDIKEIQPLINEMFELIDIYLKDYPKYKRLKRRFYKKHLELYYMYKYIKRFFKR